MFEVICVVVVISCAAINLVILGLNIKLYTEYFKDKAQDQRKRS